MNVHHVDVPIGGKRCAAHGSAVVDCARLGARSHPVYAQPEVVSIASTCTDGGDDFHLVPGRLLPCGEVVHLAFDTAQPWQVAVTDVRDLHCCGAVVARALVTATECQVNYYWRSSYSCVSQAHST